jgi:2-polyprenyl-3-methyl-5-hydroxy-6-metoxy-1,4-benzoquinol methylase
MATSRSTAADTTSVWPPEALEAVPSCPACGSRKRAVLHSGLRDRLYSAPGSWRLWRCGLCGSAFLDPRPDLESIGDAYADYYTHGLPGAPPPTGAVRQLRAALLNGHLNARYGYRLRPAIRAGAPLFRLLPRTAATADKEVRHLSLPRQGAALLDVGCGNGQFLRQATARGWRARGIDVDTYGVAVARGGGNDARVATLEDVDPGELRYDAITLMHVIEHLHRPEAALRRVYELLRPGGMAWLATPNIRALGHRMFGAGWVALDPPRHLVLFTGAALEVALRAAGFERVERLRPTADAGWGFRWSAAIARGINPFEETLPRPSLGLRARVAAADLLSARSPDAAEELMIAAWK